ncbi:MAG: nucleotidyltransferase domain-containing protein [Gallionella sp.]|nr:nucleotidyltransferase domain-containing protein [Gallionella sp.]
MRLSSSEVAAVRRVLHEIDPHGRIYLFGSRADDAKKGGDIDLFLETSIALDLKRKLALEYRLSADCDTRVDLLVKNPGQDEQAIFAIARRGIPL